MAVQESEIKPRSRALSIDTWAVILALSLAVLVRFGLLKHIGW